ncbi:MAG: cobalamin biosynthesis protein CobD [Victivallales bacterium]|nr:cobalamin biosynthesis protein CobD [Victivallales bacterium]
MIPFLLLLLLTFAMDAALGDPHSAWHPVAMFGRLAARVEHLCRQRLGNTILAGFIGWLLLTFGSAAVAWFAVRLAGRWCVAASLLLAVVIAYFTVALRSLCDHAEHVRIPLSNGNLRAARKALSMMVSRDTQNLDESEIARGTIESIGENLIDGVTSAYFWLAIGYLIGGLPLAAAAAVFLRAVNTLDACWGYENERYLLFGRVAAKADDAAHWLPARLTLLAIALAALAQRGDFWHTFHIGWKHRHDHPSPNSCFGMAGFAGALRIRLGGPTVYQGEREEYPFWGDGRAQLRPRDIKRAEVLAWSACALFLAFLAFGGALWLTS